MRGKTNRWCKRATLNRLFPHKKLQEKQEKQEKQERKVQRISQATFILIPFIIKQDLNLKGKK